MRTKSAKRARSTRVDVVVDPSATVSVTAQKALAAFRTGVRKELASFARKGIPTAATVNGQRVVGVPKKMGSAYVLVPVRARAKSHRRLTPMTSLPRWTPVVGLVAEQRTSSARSGRKRRFGAPSRKGGLLRRWSPLADVAGVRTATLFVL
jgi:hypothetical protein